MFIKCGVSAEGESHKNKNIPCQDWNEINEHNGIIFAAVADGLSSSKHSDLAAKEATAFVIKFCSDKVTKDTTEDIIIAVIRESFEKTLEHIEQRVKEHIHELDEWDTTLCLAIFFDGNVYYGQAGDSGIIALRSDGNFERIVEIEDNEDGYVEPLCRKENWVFGKYPHKVKSLMLVTDGIWGMLVPSLLKGQEHELDHSLLSYYLNNKGIYEYSQDALDEWFKADIASISPDHVNHDDKTMVMIIDTVAEFISQIDDYYKWPSKEKWNELMKAHEKELYPYRFQDAEMVEKKIDLSKGSEIEIESSVEETTDNKTRDKSLFGKMKKIFRA